MSKFYGTAVLHINKSPFSSVIESALSKEFILVWDEKKANYIIKVNSKIVSNEIIVYGENFIKSSCEIHLKIIELQNRDIIKSEVFKAIDTKVDEDSSSNGCFEKVVEQLKF